MNEQIYERLARHLDTLPGGFPATETGVELRILRHLFSPEEAELALHLTLLGEEPRVIARRAGQPVADVAQKLEEMARKGLIYSQDSKKGVTFYSAIQFVVGIWEFQVNRLSKELVQDFEEYLPDLFDAEAWQQVPQIRTIPVGKSIPVQHDVMPYEQAEEIVKSRSKIVVAPCICRQEMNLIGEGCQKPLETCLSFGSAAAYYEKHRMGRAISQQEALDVLRQANDAGLVLQPGNSQKAHFICCCCGDCCGVLRSAKRHPNPASILSSPFVATLDTESCISCGVCEIRCQMDALEMGDETPILDNNRCIGCGLCVATCPTDSLQLVRKPEAAQPPVPKNNVETHLQLGRARGKITTGNLAKMVIQSKVDRLLSR